MKTEDTGQQVFQIHWICATENREETETISIPIEFQATVLFSHIMSLHRITLVEVEARRVHSDGIRGTGTGE